MSAVVSDVDDRRFGRDHERLLFQEAFVLWQKEEM